MIYMFTLCNYAVYSHVHVVWPDIHYVLYIVDIRLGPRTLMISGTEDTCLTSFEVALSGWIGFRHACTGANFLRKRNFVSMQIDFKTGQDMAGNVTERQRTVSYSVTTVVFGPHKNLVFVVASNASSACCMQVVFSSSIVFCLR